MANDALIGPELFTFLRELEQNNNRDWFQANKKRYERDVAGPLLELIAACAAPLDEISPHIRAIPRKVGGSLFRIYRDTRFSKDKSPYKTNAGVHLRHERVKDVHAPGFYLHLEPGSVFAAAGIWHPDGATLRAIREAIVAQPERWTMIIGEPEFAAAATLEGDALKRPPRGFDPDHLLIEDLKRKDFIAVTRWDEKHATASSFLDRFLAFCRLSSPFNGFLCHALGLPW